MSLVTCAVCLKNFETLHKERERNVCYDCALKEICGKFVPEEGDFNSAGIISGEMTEQEEKWLRQDLRTVEMGLSIREDYFDEEPECPHCYNSLAHCSCNDYDEQEASEE
jgi:hypothetical protein